MANLGVRSHANSILLENIFRPQAMADKIKSLKTLSTRILTPAVSIVEDDCGTLVGRNMSSDDDRMLGLLALDSDELIDEDYLVRKYSEGIYDIRVRDTSACTSEGGICRKCLRGTYVRLGIEEDPPEVGTLVQIPTEPSSFMNYMGKTYGGSLIGVLPISSEPLPLSEHLMSMLVTDDELDNAMRSLKSFKIAPDELDYIEQIHSRFEKALMIIAYYGVYSNATI